MNKTSIKNRGSVAVQALEVTWTHLRQGIPRLPAAVIVLLGVSTRRRKAGHFSGCCWRYRKDGAHEVAINPVLFAEAGEVLGTMVHEAAHALLFATTGGSGCSGQYYHLHEFRDVCEKLGLECKFRNTRYGWCDTQWPETGVPSRYNNVLKTLEDGLPLGTAKRIVIPRVLGNPLPEPGRVRLVCSCQPTRSIYVSQSMAIEPKVMCQNCQQPFAMSSAEREESLATHNENATEPN